MLNFKKVTIEDKAVLMPMLTEYGGDSCQYSFAQMLGLSDKYGDEYALVDGGVIVHRSGRDTEGKRVYLAPIGNIEGREAMFVQYILSDAKEHGASPVFETVTEDFAELMETEFPGVFDCRKVRDLAEYIYDRETLALLPGRNLAAKRNRITKFYETYGVENVRIEHIGAENMADVAAFQEKWLRERKSDSEDLSLEGENKAIQYYLEHFAELGFVGIVVYVSNVVAGFAAGVALSSQCIDEVIEKGDIEYVGIYQLLCREFAAQCGEKYSYVNREEDLGIEGLRRSKLTYQPAFLLEKCIMTLSAKENNSLSDFISGEDCAGCRFCCSFRRCSAWETPLFTPENIAAMEKSGKPLLSELIMHEDRSGAVYATYDLLPKYATDDPAEEVICPFLDVTKGCTLSAEEKPWDCKIWPLRVAKRKGGEPVVVLEPTCPSMNRYDAEMISSYVNRAHGAQTESMKESLLHYAKEHPYLIKEFEEDFFIEL